MDKLLLIIISVPLVILGIRYVLKVEKVFVSKKVIKTFWIIYVSSICFYLTALELSYFNIFIRGYRSTSFIFIGMSLIGVLYSIFSSIDKRADFLISGRLFFTISCFVLSVILTWEVIDDYNKQLYYNDNKYRLEEVCRAIMCGCEMPHLFVKYGIIEREYTFDDMNRMCFTKEDIKSIRINEIMKDSISISIFHSQEKDNIIHNPQVYYLRLK